MLEFVAGFALALLVHYVLTTWRDSVYYPSIYWTWCNGLEPRSGQRQSIGTDPSDLHAIPSLANGHKDGDFLWGACTASHQIEGESRNNQWWRWETFGDELGQELRARGGGGVEGERVAGGQTSGRAVEHWERVEEDVGLLKALGLSAYRFSLAWGRLEPRQGEFDEEAIEHYRDELRQLRAAGIEPMVTLHHFVHPCWFEDMGAFEREENVDVFVRFAMRMLEEFHDLVDLWCTVNEPTVYATGGYVDGRWPPGKRDLMLAGRVNYHMLLASARIHRAFHRSEFASPQMQVGPVKDIFIMDPYRPLFPPDWVVAKIVDGLFNEAALGYLRDGRYRMTVGPCQTIDIPCDPDLQPHLCYDFIGLNYYSHYSVRAQLSLEKMYDLCHVWHELKHDMPQTIYPEGLYRALKRLNTVRRGVPIYVTENGVADERDDRRQLFIRRYLAAMNRAIAEGVQVRGYFYWTLMDNFEWSEGYTQKFGLYEVDFDTQERKLRDGSKFYRDVVRYHRRLGE